MMKCFLGDIQLPVNPFDSVKVEVPGKNKSYELVKLGEITRIRDRGLARITIQSLFPATRYPFVAVDDFLEPESYIEYINRIIAEKKSTRLIIVGDGIDFNTLVSIEGFDYEQRSGEPGEYYFKLELKEYREHSAKRVVVTSSNQSSGKVNYTEVKERPVTKEIPKEYVVKSGDTLWAIAKSSLGQGERYAEIASINGINPPYIIRPGQKLKLPS